MSARIIESYVHQRRIGVLLEMQAESDYATLTDEFRSFARDVLLQIAASSPRSVPELLEQISVREASVTVAQALRALQHTLRETIHIVRFERWDTETPSPSGPEPPTVPGVRIRAVRQ